MDTCTTKELETFTDFWVKYFVNKTFHPALNSFVDGLNALFPPKLLGNEAWRGGGTYFTTTGLMQNHKRFIHRDPDMGFLSIC